METTIKLPKQLINGHPDFPSEIISDSGKAVCNVNVYSNPEIKAEIIKRYNNYNGVKMVAIVMTVIAVVSLFTLLYVNHG